MYGCSAMHEMTGKTSFGFFVFTKWQQGQCQVFTVAQANQKLLALGSAGMSDMLRQTSFIQL